MSAYAIGVDFGSITAKTVILDFTGKVVAACVASMGAVSGEGVKAAMAGPLQQAGIERSDVTYTVSTGYGRRMLDASQKSYT